MEVLQEFEVIQPIVEKKEIELQKNIKTKLLWYLLTSVISFSWLVFIRDAGVSVPIFMVIQFGFLWFLMPKRKPLILFIPIFILSLNSFISANQMWRIPNFFAIIALFSVMSLWSIGDFTVSGPLMEFIKRIIGNAFHPFIHVSIPLKWVTEMKKETTKDSTKTNRRVVIRVILGVLFALPLLFLILVMLSSADAIFARGLADVIESIVRLFSFGVTIDPSGVWRGFAGLVAGFYMFGFLYFIYTYQPKSGSVVYKTPKEKQGDLLIINIVIGSILVVYSLFVLIQFRYLFLGSSNLPHGLNYADYARRVFFELLFLSFVNITIILTAIGLTKNQQGNGMKISCGLCTYLCVVTMVLLISSFYRMSLYSAEYGLTRLRFLVFGFLIFEAVGLLFTMGYIVKPKFNIIAIYSVIALSYYLLLNIVPMDAIIARNQVDRYFATGGNGIEYVMNLSADAAGQIERLRASDNLWTLQRIEKYHLRIELGDADWRQWNLSTARASRD